MTNNSPEISGKLGDLLIHEGVITSEQLKEVLVEQKKTGKRFGEILVDMGFADGMTVARYLGLQLHIPYTNLNTVVVEPDAIDAVPEKLAIENLLIPITIDQKVITVAMSDPLDFIAIKDLRFATGRQVVPTIAIPGEIRSAIPLFYHLTESLHEIVDVEELAKGALEFVPEPTDHTSNIEDDIEKAEIAPIVKIVDSILYNAVKNRASDIHIEPRDDNVVVRTRVDGLLREVSQLPKWTQGAVVSRVKIMASMDIAEKRIPQDGRIKIRVEGRELDIRVSTLPIQHGEGVVMRILDAASAVVELGKLGLSKSDLVKVCDIIERPQGSVLVTGATGSGKSSTLYAMLHRIKKEELNIITLEDPIEYELKGANQVAINEKTGLTFAFGLRSILRQDPDIVMVGEMRDAETVSIATQASLTGHLVLSTLHTNTAVSSITRLRHLLDQSFLIASSLNGIIAQKLVRKLCGVCKQAYIPSCADLLKLGIRDADRRKIRFYKGVGCDQCTGSGYKGRIGIFEVLICNHEIRELIATDATEEKIRKAALENGMTQLSEDGIEKVKDGVTSIDELLRVLYVSEEHSVHICRNCSSPVKTNFSNCPFCGLSIEDRCPSCKVIREADWKFCPQCRHEYNKVHPITA